MRWLCGHLFNCLEANNPSDDKAYFLKPTILMIMKILPEDAREKKGKTKPTKIEDADEKKWKKANNHVS